MMKVIVFLAVICLICFQRSYGTDTNYFLGTLDGSTPAAFAFDKCVLDTDGTRSFTCNGDGTVTESFYSGGTSCSGTPATTDYTDTTADFNCDGVDSYVTIDVRLADCTSSLGISTTLAVDVCYEQSTGVYTMISCNETSYTTTLYSDSGCTMETSSTPAPQCTYYTDVDVGIPFGVQSLYSYVTSCVYGVPPTTGAPDEPSTTTDSSDATDAPDNTEDDMGTTTPPSGTEDDMNEMTTTETGGDMTTTPSGTVKNIDLSEYVSNYFYGTFLEISVPFPTDVCVQVGSALLGDDYAYATISCSDDGSTVTYTPYSTSDCESGTEGDAVLSYTHEEATFDCSDYTNYASLELYGNDACTFALGTLYAAVGECFFVDTGDEAYYAAVTCDGSNGEIELAVFEDANCTTTVEVASVSECTYFLTYSSFDVSYDAGECVIVDPTPMPTPKPTSADDGNGDSATPVDDQSQSIRWNQVSQTVGFACIIMLIFMVSVTII